jgi:hypothetical protein
MWDGGGGGDKNAVQMSKEQSKETDHIKSSPTESTTTCQNHSFPQYTLSTSLRVISFTLLITQIIINGLATSQWNVCYDAMDPLKYSLFRVRIWRRRNILSQICVVIKSGFARLNTSDSLNIYISADYAIIHQELHETVSSDDGIVCRNIYIEWVSLFFCDT